ncbi:MAG TPA: MBL fold metallo-hydrolase [Rhodopila sp.]|jgi:glyoxylase-like metal-dependent hydrolase (beta-lactamase superfamily II)|nr:MBL fold metallo-hydrolase [Rhodopila sp.]
MATTTFNVGDITIHRVVEQEAPFFDPLTFFPTLTPDILAANKGWMTDGGYLDRQNGQLVLCIQSYLIRTKHHNILIDSCVGNHKPRPTRPFWNMMDTDRFEKNLAGTGVSVDQIDYVMCTHLHVDHVGWNTKLENGRWVPTFPKAKYIFADKELAHWTEAEKHDPSAAPWITDSVLPIIAARREEVVTSSHQFSDTIKLIPTPGHTIDHYSVRLGQPGADAVITGDMIHSPLQARYPEMGMRVDHDSPTAGRSRRALFGDLCDTSTLVCTAHFPSPSSGRIKRWDDGFKFEPV